MKSVVHEGSLHMELIREFCAENMTLVPAAVAAGARRIELCDNLAVGGTSPSYGVTRAAVAFARESDVAVMVMVRPRGGDFVYDRREREMMLDDITCARRLGATGVVFGCLQRGAGTGFALDTELTKTLVEAAKGQPGPMRDASALHVTFHMAFDELEEPEQLRAIDELAQLGVERILTHGGPAGTSIADNVEHLRRLVAHANGRLTIMPGGGLTWQNARQVADQLGVCEVHGTRIVRL